VDRGGRGDGRVRRRPDAEEEPIPHAQDCLTEEEQATRRRRSRPPGASVELDDGQQARYSMSVGGGTHGGFRSEWGTGLDTRT
jgi:hypothetical protein